MAYANYWTILVLVWGIFDFVELAPDSSCNSQWQGYSRCMRNQLAKNNDPRTGLPKPSNSVMINMQLSNIRNCFKENNCKDPLAPEANSRARGLCFPNVLKDLRNEMQSCVQKKNLSNFALPDDEYSAASGSNDVLLLLAITALQNVKQYCPSSVSPQTVTSCVAKKWSTSGYTTPAPTSVSYCDTVRQCKSVSFMSEKCDSGWNDVVCTCVQSLRFLGTVSKYENQYIDCMKKVGITVDRTNEVPLSWLDTSVKGWCDQTSTTRSINSWSPGNRYCDATTTAQTTTTEAVTEPEEITTQQEEQETTPYPDDNNNVQETTPYEEPAQETTRRTYFFDQFTFETEGEPAPTTTPVPTTTIPSNWPTFMKDYLGIDDPRNGVWGEIFNPSKWFNQG